MKKNVHSYLLIPLLLLVLPVHSLVGQTPVWSEEFNTGSRIDPKTWIYTTGGGGFGNNELQYYTDRPENLRIEDGSLVIEARKENYENRKFTSGRINTLGRFAFKYGTIEARIKLPNVANGLWPAFWMMGANFGNVGWPRCGEIDILELGSKDAITAGVVNRRVGAAIHWFEDAPAPGGYAGTSSNTVVANDFYLDYHLFKLDWTPSAVTVYVDNVAFFTRDITDVDKSEFHNFAFILLNMAVGGNYPGITNPDLITATFPGKMYVDYVRVYDNGYTETRLASNTALKGPFGIWTETTPVVSQVDFTKATLYVWNNMTPVSTAPYEGSSVLSYHINTGAWYGMGISSTEDINLSRFANGYLHMHVKTNGTQPISFGFINSAYSSTNNGEAWYTFNGAEYGLIRDGQWHEVVVPMNKFDDIDYNTIKQVLTVKGAAPTTAFDLAIDNVYLTESVPLEAPQNGNFVLLSETAPRVDEFIQGTDGNLYIWENTLAPIAQTPYEGTQSLAYRTTLQNNPWFGFGFNPNLKYNLSAFRYPDSRLHFAMKTTSTATIRIGIKSGSLPGVGLKYISFVNGSDPYGFVRDGQWHVVEIPLSDYTDVVDLSNVSELFMVSGSGAASDLQFDDIYFKNGGQAIVEGTDPVVSFTSPSANATVSGTIAINAAAYAPTVGTADGAGINNVLFELLNGGTVVASLRENIKPYDWSLNTKLYPNGIYTLRATATGTAAAGGTATANSITITINNVTGDPVVQFTTPAANATISGTTAINAVAYDPDIATTDGAGISNIFFELLQGTTVKASLRENIKTYDWSLNTRLYPDGAYTLRATATSTTAAGGTAKSVTIPVTIANTTVARIAGDEQRSESRAVTLSPNPAARTVYINCGDEGYTTLYILDTQGQVYHTANIGQQRAVEVEVSSLPKGIYYVRLIGTSMQVLKFIKQ
ncbi:MAG TPA: family 16 glycosylhydrolase [Ohtaekwangia sp.]|uniref:family 16 glycosylhydrolase n=1 Tax=Ohtaekwangia sp. TaxID=2066019 RepID=UPI002F94C4DF